MSSGLLKISFRALQFGLLLVLSVRIGPSEGERYCGSKLSEALQIICGSRFSKMTKRSIDPVDYYSDVELKDPYQLEDWPFFSARGAANGLVQTRRKRPGVYDECCKKPCTRSELQSYCL